MRTWSPNTYLRAILVVLVLTVSAVVFLFQFYGWYQAMGQLDQLTERLLPKAKLAHLESSEDLVPVAKVVAEMCDEWDFHEDPPAIDSFRLKGDLENLVLMRDALLNRPDVCGQVLGLSAGVAVIETLVELYRSGNAKPADLIHYLDAADDAGWYGLLLAIWNEDCDGRPSGFSPNWLTSGYETAACTGVVLGLQQATENPRDRVLATSELVGDVCESAFIGASWICRRELADKEGLVFLAEYRRTYLRLTECARGQLEGAARPGAPRRLEPGLAIS